MTVTDMNGWTVAHLRLLEVPPSDDWLHSGASAAATRERSKLFEAQVQLPAAERAQVLYFDLLRFTDWEDAVSPIADWARRYRESLPAETVPATLVAVGKSVTNEGRRRLSKANVYYLNERRGSLHRRMGSGDRAQQICRLIQSLVGSFALTAAHHGTTPAQVAGRGAGSAQPSASDWDAYTQRPQHVDHGEVEALFEKLSKKPEVWERDH